MEPLTICQRLRLLGRTGIGKTVMHAGRPPVHVCVYWPPTGTGLSHDRRFNAQGRAPAQTAAARDTNSYPRYSPTTLVHVSELSPAEATAARNDGELPGSGEALLLVYRLCLFPLARLAREAWRDGIKAITMGLRRWPHDGARGAMRLESLNALRKDYWWVQARIRSFLVRTG